MIYLFDMDNIDLILSFSAITKTISKLKTSLADIEKKSAHRKDLIDSNLETQKELTEAYLIFKEMETELRGINKRLYQLENILLSKEAELRELKAKNENLLNGL